MVSDYTRRAVWTLVRGRSPAGIVCSNLTVGHDVCLSVECRVSSGTGLCVGPITHPEESHRVWCVCERDASIMRRQWPNR